MMYWLIIIILAYLFFALFSLGDKLVLGRGIHPKSYTFYVGIFNVFAIFLLPFVHFVFPTPIVFMIIILDAFSFIGGLYTMFLALKDFEVSRAMPIIGGIQPIFIFLFGLLYFGFQPIKTTEIIAFSMFILASFLISIEKSIRVNKYFLKVTILSGVLFALDYVLLKVIFLQGSFLLGLIWTRVAITFFALFLLFDKELRHEAFSKKQALGKNIFLILVLTQICGAVASLLQNFAISLAPIAYLALLNSLRGIQYVFLFVITLIISHVYPKIFNEPISKRIVFQKLVATLLMVVGLFILVEY